MSTSKDYVLMACGFILAATGAVWLFTGYQPASMPQSKTADTTTSDSKSHNFTLLLQNKGNSFYCDQIGGYESRPSCEIYWKKNDSYVSTGLVATNDTGLLISPDKAHILVLQGAVSEGADSNGRDSASVLNVSDGSHYLLYEAPKDTYLGVLTDNIDFRGRARWVNNSTVEFKVYAVDRAHEGDSVSGKEESKPLFIKQISLIK